MVYSCDSPMSSFQSRSASEIKLRNSEIFRRNIVESYEFDDKPENFVTELLDECGADLVSPGILFNKNYSSGKDFVDAMFDHIKPILANGQVPSQSTGFSPMLVFDVLKSRILIQVLCIRCRITAVSSELLKETR
jgi:hypothetical protein